MVRVARRIRYQSLLLIGLVGALSFIVVWPLVGHDFSTFTDAEFFNSLRDDDPALLNIKEAAKENISNAKELFLSYYQSRPSDPNFHVSGNLDSWRVAKADDVIRRIFNERDVTRQFKNFSSRDSITVNGRVIPNSNWHENPYPEDDEWIWSWSQFGWIRDYCRVYLGYADAGNDTRARYYARAMVDLLTDFISKEPVGNSFTWRTLDSAKRVSNLLILGETMKNSSAFTADFCTLFIKFILDHGRFFFYFHKTIFNWAFVESLGSLELCSNLPEFYPVTGKWEQEAWDTFVSVARNSFYPDGGSREQAFIYHQLSMEKTASAILLDQSSDNIDGPAILLDLIKNAYVFTVYNAMPDWTRVGWGDSNWRSLSGNINVGKVLYPGDPVFAYLLNDSLPAPNLSVAFPDSGQFISRSRWNDINALYSFVDGSPAGEFYHHHEDLGNVVFYGFGRMFLIDPGISSYTLNDYSRYFKSSHAHNLALIDDKSQGSINPSKTEFMAGYLGSVVRVGHAKFGALLDREVIFCNFRNEMDDPNLENTSTSADSSRYWIVSDYWHGSGNHGLSVNWQMPNTTLQLMDNESNDINPGEENTTSYFTKTVHGSGNVGIYSYGPWDDVDVIRAGSKEEYGQLYGWRADTEEFVDDPGDENVATTLRFTGRGSGKQSWFSLFYPANVVPNVSVQRLPFTYKGVTYPADDRGNPIGNVFMVSTSSGTQLHVSLQDTTSGTDSITVTLPAIGKTVEFQGKHLSLHFNVSSSDPNQILASNVKMLTINGETLLTINSGILAFKENNTLECVTLGTAGEHVASIFVGSSEVPAGLFEVEDNAVTLERTILGGHF
ncbi:MAG: heparinase II/III family protein [Promethearchaeota archaeon]